MNRGNNWIAGCTQKSLNSQILTSQSHNPSISHQNDGLWLFRNMQACQLHEHSGNCSPNCFTEVIWTISVLSNKADAIIFWNVKVLLDPFFFSPQTLKTLQPNIADCHNLWQKNTFKTTWSHVSFFLQKWKQFWKPMWVLCQESFVFEFGEEKHKMQSN